MPGTGRLVVHGLCTVHLLSVQFLAMTLRAGVAKLAGAALAGSLLIAVAPAAAQPCHQHHGSGNSEVAQYLETIPGLCGNQPIGGNGAGHHGTSGGSSQGLSGSNAAGLPPGTISQLESMKPPAGSQAAGFAESTASGGTGGGNPSGVGPGSAGSAAGGTASAGGGSLLSALGHMLTGNNASAGASGEGLGAWLPILFGMVLIGGLGVLALRRGRTG
jgi:hypothetical protein